MARVGSVAALGCTSAPYSGLFYVSGPRMLGMPKRKSRTAEPSFGKWVVVKIMVPFRILSIIRHLVFRGPKGDQNFDNHPDANPDGKHSLLDIRPGQTTILFKPDALMIRA